MKKFLALAAALALSFSVTACSVDNDNNAADTIDRTTYKVGVGSYTTTEDSSSSVEDSSGKGVVSTTYATVIFDENDIIRKIYIDEVESKIYFDSKGHLDESKNNKVVRSKRELGDEYGMKAASNIGKEWYEQINSLEDYLVGKNIRNISDFVMNNGDYGTENDYANSLGNENNGENMAGNAINDAVDGAKNIADGIMNGARNILGRNGSSSDGNGTSTAEGITDNTDGSVADGTNDYNSGTDNTDGNMADNGTDGTSTGNINWEEDLKSSVTIDLKNIQKAVQKAYENAR
ncbi:MAG: hypothetical protein IKU47_00440 [Oscillospiraceae bacterium]|nr:hypothetical protein [Oscillospiraceae bacterium]